MKRFEDWLFEYFIRFFLFTISFVLLVSFGFYYICNNYPTITLNKNEWKCMRTHKEMVQRTRMIGKLYEVYYNIEDVCDLYEKRVIK